MNITVISGKGNKVRSTELNLPANATVAQLKLSYEKVSKKSVHRQSFKFGDTENLVRLDDDSKTLTSYGISSGTSVTFKDLGPQIGYRTVFLIEYLGPLLFVAFHATRPSFLFGAEASKQPFHWVAMLGIAAWTFHFLKRQFETIFIHKFSRATMPLSNLIKNSIYYWSFGLVIGYPLCSPSYTPPSDIQVYIGFVIFLLSELGNLAVHIQLSNMRPAEGSQKRDIPKGFLFNYVACPNYTFEVLSWVGFSIFTQITFAYVFTIVGFLQMADWAQKKHRGYKKTYDKEYVKLRRKAIIPFIY